MDGIQISGATVLTGTGDLRPDTTVLIENGRIAAVSNGAQKHTEGPVLDAAGKFLMAGFIDAHTHLALPDVPERPEPHPDTPFLAARAAREKLASGVTTVRDVGGKDHVDLALRRAIRNGDVPGPRMLAAGKAIVATGGHIHYFAREADGPYEVRKAVREQIKAGADVIKLMLSGGVANVGEQPDRMQFQSDEIQAAVAEAVEAGKSMAAHAYSSDAVRVAAEVGFASVEHGVWLDDEAIETLVHNAVYLVPTQAVYKRLADTASSDYPRGQMQKIWAEKKVSLKRAIEAGVKIGVGTDCGRHFPHGNFVDELLRLHEAGMSTEQVLLAATLGNAQLLGLSDEIGSIEVGKRADLVLLEGNPLADLEQARSVALIVQDGQIRRPQALLHGNT